ncbi:MAG: hypothetical protein DRR03_07570, partial [Gammaproteobacteria bacterium]
AGLDDHLTKPLDEQLLVRVLQRWLPADITAQAGLQARIPADPPPGKSPVHDSAGALLITGGRPELAREMLSMFISEVPQHRAALDEGWRSSDPAQLMAVLHKLRGSAEYCALPRLSNAVGLAEESLAKGRMDQAEPLVAAVREELELAVAEAVRQIG